MIWLILTLCTIFGIGAFAWAMGDWRRDKRTGRRY